MAETFDPLCSRLGHRFSDEGLLRDALTHRSAGAANYERLEFLGDAMLNFVVADMLFSSRPQASEGELSRLRATLVNRDTLAAIANEIQLGEYLTLGSGELKSGGFRRSSILADAMEAVIGAVYRDAGFEACRRLVEGFYESRVAALPPAADLKDPKTRLQELLQGRQRPLPVYRVVDVSGDDHEQVFRVECEVEGLAEAPQATGGSRRKAEQAAAQQALEKLQTDG